MSRKKKQEHVNHERWLVSYADFITLLFAFFVVLFASSQSDKKKQIQLAASMQTAFSQMGIFDAHSKQPPLAERAGSAVEGHPVPAALPLQTAAAPTPPPALNANAVEHLQRVIDREMVGRNLPRGSVQMHRSADGTVVSLREAGFFASGSAEVRQDSIALLAAIARELPAGPLRVEGHTDDRPIHTPQYATNWELSTARAAVIARLLIEQRHVKPADLSAAGYAEFHPFATNETEQGRALNRRVDIIILSPASPAR